MDIVGCILLLLVLALSSAFYSAGEIAILAVSDARLSQLAEEGNARASRVLKLKSKPARFLSSVQVVSAVCGALAAAFSAAVFAKLPTDALLGAGFPLPGELVFGVFAVVITLLLCFVVLLFGCFLPRRLAARNPEGTALALSGIVCFLSRLFAPMTALLIAVTNLFLRTGGGDSSEEDTVSEEEIRTLVDRGAEKGILDDDESEIIQNLFEFDDLTVGKIAVHRTEAVMLEAASTPEEWEKTLNETRHTLYPVVGESVDDVIGVLDARDFFHHRDLSRDEMLKTIVKPAYFVPETVKADVLFRQMKSSGNGFAVVLDEYGGMLGIITLHDLIEQLLGDMETEESVAEEPDVAELGDGTFRVRGTVMLDDLNEELGINLPTDEYDTFGGYVFGLYGSVPEDGSEIDVETDAISIHVEKIEDHKLLFAVVTLKKEKEKEEE